MYDVNNQCTGATKERSKFPTQTEPFGLQTVCLGRRSANPDVHITLTWCHSSFAVVVPDQLEVARLMNLLLPL